MAREDIRTTMLRHLVGKPSHNGRISDWDLERRLTQLEMLLVALKFATPEQVWPGDERVGRHERR